MAEFTRSALEISLGIEDASGAVEDINLLVAESEPAGPAGGEPPKAEVWHDVGG
jgi:hypothetical protein